MSDTTIAMPFSDVLERVTRDGGTFRVEPSEEWRQGRTLFGGLSAALALTATTKAFPDLPPLRSAEIAFIGPAAGALSFTPRLLRSGKSATFASVEATSNAETVFGAILMFAAARPSRHAYAALPMPEVAAPDTLPAFFDSPAAPVFARQFVIRRAGGATPVSGAKKPELLLWIRHRDAQAPDTLASILALGDVPPPAAMTMFTAPAPISTVTWSVEVLDNVFIGAGWHLLHVEAESVRDGYSSQRMTLWNANGTPLLSARQSVALFD